jgi:hypothetical protein
MNDGAIPPLLHTSGHSRIRKISGPLPEIQNRYPNILTPQEVFKNVSVTQKTNMVAAVEINRLILFSK